VLWNIFLRNPLATHRFGSENGELSGTPKALRLTFMPAVLADSQILVYQGMGVLAFDQIVIEEYYALVLCAIFPTIAALVTCLRLWIKGRDKVSTLCLILPNFDGELKLPKLK
jgi:hypothetical protein